MRYQGVADRSPQAHIRDQTYFLYLYLNIIESVVAVTTDAGTKSHMLSRSVREVIMVGACVVLTFGAASSATAETPFDGEWKLSVVTKSGSCGASYSFTAQVINGIGHIPIGDQNAYSARVAPNGSVSAWASMGGIHGVAWGRVSTKSGGGKWRAQLQDGACSGVWSGERE